MKKRNFIIAICIFCLIVFLTILVIVLKKYNNCEYYVTDYESLYDIAIDYIIEEEYQSNNPDVNKDNYRFFVTYDGFGITEKDNYKYAYMWILGESYYLENGEQKLSHSYSMFYKFTFLDNKVIKYENPEDGNEYLNSIKKLSVDKNMRNKIVNYESKLSNEEKIKDYYLKVMDSANLELNDIISDNGLLFTINWKKADCIPVSLSVYENGRYELATNYEACKPGVVCTAMLTYTQKEEGTYNYEVLNIIKNSIIADDMTFTNDTLPEFEIYTGNGDKVYMMVTDSNNKYLNDFLSSINVNLRTCAIPDYK